MELTEEQFERIKDCLPRQRGNVSIDNRRLLNALLFVLENGCKWRAVPQHQHQGASRRHGGTQKNGPQALGRSRGGRTTKVHLVAASERCALKLCLSPGQRGDAPVGRELLGRLGRAPTRRCALLMDCAYQGNETRALARSLGYVPVVPPNPLRRKPWRLNRTLYRRRNEVERLFRRLKSYRRVFTRYDKLNTMFLTFVHLPLCYVGVLTGNCPCHGRCHQSTCQPRRG